MVLTTRSNPDPASPQHVMEIGQCLTGLRFDPTRDEAAGGRVQTELTGSEDKVAGPDGNGIGANGLGSFIAGNDFFIHTHLSLNRFFDKKLFLRLQ